MAVVIFVEKEGNKIKKSSLEALSFGRDFADQKGLASIAVTFGATDSAILSKHGATRIIELNGDSAGQFSPNTYVAALATVCQNEGASSVIVSSTYTGKSVAGGLAVRLEAALATGVIELPSNSDAVVVKKSCFSNKAFSQIEMAKDICVIGLVPNSYEVKDYDGSAEVSSAEFSDVSTNTKSISTDKVEGKIPLTEAELVVSAGRGMKGPENWGMIEELADILGAATACSKPVADMDWRPHNEHVGQTGITIKANLYIAVGISGAIQHLAGVGSSKVICVINTDPEAPFFKAADYGIVGDAFEVIPKLIARAKELKA
jgi:electron transfer flavoprotein alpha subunit